MDTCILDASVAVKLFLDQPLRDEARALLAGLDDSPPLRVAAPDLLYAECANVLWKYARIGYPVAEAAAHLEDLRALPIAITPTYDLAPEALRIAAALDVSVYDACYLALASILGWGLVTADERLVRRVAGTRSAATWLGAL